jgi:mono/diheme cytochrome c family protein
LGQSRKTASPGIRFRKAALSGPPCAVILLLVASRALGVQQVAADAPPLTVAAAKALKSPVPFTSESIGRGKRLYQTHGCANCHGSDGKALVEVVANATDLTDPSVWKNGTDEGLVFRSIRDGAGLAMPPFKAEVTAPEELWHLANFVRSLWSDDRRPSMAKQ